MSDIVLGIRLTADGKDLVGAVKVSSAEIDKMAGATKRAGSEADRLNAQQRGLGDTLNSTASRIGLYSVAWNKAVDAITQAARAIQDYVKDAALLNARHETMGVVLGVVGRNAGYSRREMDAYTEAVRKNGITLIAAREGVVKMTQANLDLGIASKLARAAQDAAVIANINSSEAFTRLIYAIQSGQPEMLRTMGINATFETSYAKLAKQLGVTTEQLTEQEKVQARANVTLEATTTIAGAYEAAMDTAGKKLNSLARYTEDLKVRLGETFNDALVIAVDSYTDALKKAGDKTDDLARNNKLKEWGRNLVEVIAYVIDQFKVFKFAIVEIATPIERLYKNLSTVIASWTILLSNTSFEEKVSAMTQMRDDNGAYFKALNARLAANRNMRSAVSEMNAYFTQKDAEANARSTQAALEIYEVANMVSPKAPPTPRPAATGAGSDPYPAMLKNLKEKLLLDHELTEVNKLQLSLDALSEKQLAKLTPMRKAELENLAAQVDLNKRNKESWENAAKNEEALQKARKEGIQSQATYDQKRGEALISAYKLNEQMEFETTLIGATNTERETAIALRALEAGAIDKQGTSYERLREKIKDAIANKNIAEEGLRQQVGFWQSVESAGHQAWLSIFDTSKTVIERIRDMLKTHLIETLYQMTLKKWYVQIVTSTSGAGVAQSAFGSTGGMSGGLNLLSSASNLTGAAGIFGSAGAYAAAVPGLTSAAVGSQAALLAAQTGAFGAQGLAATAAAGGSTLGGGISAAMAAIPGWGWAALGAAAIGAYLLSDEGDAQRTGNWSAGFGQAGRSTKNKWFDASTGAGPFAEELAASERRIADLLKVSAEQSATINTALDALSGNQYGFGMERTDWMQSGAAQAIAADRLRAIAESLGLSIEALAAKMNEAQKVIDLAPAKLQLEIDLMKAQGNAAGALAAERKRELAALDPALHALQEQVWAAQDLAAAATDAAGAVGSLTRQISDMQKAASSAVDAQISASRSAGQAARSAADAYRGLTTSLADAVRQLRGGDLSPLLPKQKLDEARSNVEAAYVKAQTQDAAAIAALPQLVTEFVTASRAYNASSDAFTADFNRGVEILANAGAASDAAAVQQDYMAVLYELQTGLLGEIKAELAKPSPDTAILAEQTKLLSTIGVLLSDQTDVILTGNATQDVIRDITAADTGYSADTLAALIAGDADQNVGLNKTVALLQQLLYLNVVAEKAAAEQSVFAAADAFVRGAKDYAAQNATSYFAVESTLYQGLTPTGSGGSSVKALYDSYKSSIALMLNLQQQLAALDRIGAASAYYDLPQHASGLAYVPRDDYPMMAHQGEAVVDASTMSALRSYGIQVGGGLTKADVDALMDAIAKTNAILQRLAEVSSRDVKDQTTHLTTALEESAQIIGRTVARAAEAGARA